MTDDAAPPARAADIADRLCYAPEGLGTTRALLVLRDGTPVVERYDATTDAHTRLISWSMAKSVVQALVWCAIDDGTLPPDALERPAPVAAWRTDARAAITLGHLLTMRSGLAFREDYVDGERSDVIEMLFGAGKDDVAGFAASMAAAHPPGTHWSYSSGDTNIVCGILRDAVGGGADGMRAYMQRRLFDRIGVRGAEPRFDAAGTFIGSSFLYGTAREFAAFGEAYRTGSLGARGVAHARTPTPTPDTEHYGYGAHWWLWPYPGAFAAHGYEGQHIVVVPDRRLVVVRLGTTPDAHGFWVRAMLHRLIEAFPA